MSEEKGRRDRGFDRARDELFSHIHRCGVLRATREQQIEWIEDTMTFVAERFPQLTGEDLAELRTIGTRFCQPVIDNVPPAEPSDTQTAGAGADTDAGAAAA